MADNVFLLSLLIIFVGAFLASMLKRRRLDRVLKDLRGFNITCRIAHKTIWGRMCLYPNAVELVFSRIYKNRRGKLLTSFIMYAPQLEKIDAIYRFHDELTPENQKRRLREVEKTANPGLLRRLKRTLRNLLVSFRDAIDESIGLLLSRVQRYSTTVLNKDNKERLQKIGSSTLGEVSNMAYDPVLERYIAHRVVTEMRREDDSVVEYEGVLKEYSSHWFSVLDCNIKEEDRIPLSDAERLMLQRKLDFEILLESGEEKKTVSMRMTITNRDAEPLALWHIEDGHGFQHDIDVLLTPGHSTEIRIDALPETCLTEIDRDALPMTLSLVAPERTGQSEEETQQTTYPPLPLLSLVHDTTRIVDIYLPRNKAVVRHGGEFLDQ
jgi:hypothetical protein